MGNWLTKTRHFIAGTLEELHKCTWPKRSELYESTVIVIISAIVLSCFVALIDFGAQKIIRLLTGS